MTGSQDYTATAPPMAVSQHSPASTSSTSSTSSDGGYSVSTTSRHSNPPPAPRAGAPFTASYPPFAPTPECPPDPAAHRPTSLPCPYPPLINCDTGKGQHMAGNGEALPPNFMPWESSDGTTHYTPSPGYTYDASSPMPVVVTPPNGISQPCDPNHGVTVTMCNNGQQGEINSRGQHTVHFHVHQGEAVSLQLGEQVENFILAFSDFNTIFFCVFFCSS